MASESASAPFAVIGATGRQGGAVVDALLAAGAAVRALVRDPHAPAAEDLAARGVELVQADQEDAASLEAALGGVAALFFHTTFAGADGVAGEVRRGTRIVDAAVAAAVPRVVFSSVGGAERDSGVPHFDSKRSIELHLDGRLPAKIVRPVFFMENLAGQLAPDDRGEIVVRMPLPADVPVQLVAVRDIGRVAARLLLEPDALVGDAVEIAGDERTMAEAAAEIADVLGYPARYEEVPLDVLGDDTDLRAMFRWFAQTPAYLADRALTRELDPQVLDLRAWLEEQSTDDAD